jgi:hypothetical protein
MTLLIDKKPMLTIEQTSRAFDNAFARVGTADEYVSFWDETLDSIDNPRRGDTKRLTSEPAFTGINPVSVTDLDSADVAQQDSEYESSCLVGRKQHRAIKNAIALEGPKASMFSQVFCDIEHVKSYVDFWENSLFHQECFDATGKHFAALGKIAASKVSRSLASKGRVVSETLLDDASQCATIAAFHASKARKPGKLVKGTWQPLSLIQVVWRSARKAAYQSFSSDQFGRRYDSRTSTKALADFSALVKDFNTLWPVESSAPRTRKLSDLSGHWTDMAQRLIAGMLAGKNLTRHDVQFFRGVCFHKRISIHLKADNLPCKEADLTPLVSRNRSERNAQMLECAYGNSWHDIQAGRIHKPIAPMVPGSQPHYSKKRRMTRRLILSHPNSRPSQPLPMGLEAY